jgi:hypothetical protein
MQNELMAVANSEVAGIIPPSLVTLPTLNGLQFIKGNI